LPSLFEEGVGVARTACGRFAARGRLSERLAPGRRAERKDAGEGSEDALIYHHRIHLAVSSWGSRPPWWRVLAPKFEGSTTPSRPSWETSEACSKACAARSAPRRARPWQQRQAGRARPS